MANQFFFLLNLLLFGIVSGSAIFTAQFWGRRDLASIRQVMGISLLFSVAGALAFTAIAVLTPEGCLASIRMTRPSSLRQPLSADRRAELCGHCDHLHVSAVLRSTEHVRLPTAVSVTALSLKTG